VLYEHPKNPITYVMGVQTVCYSPLGVTATKKKGIVGKVSRLTAKTICNRIVSWWIRKGLFNTAAAALPVIDEGEDVFLGGPVAEFDLSSCACFTSAWWRCESERLKGEMAPLAGCDRNERLSCISKELGA
jgi:hypothetical protein